MQRRTRPSLTTTTRNELRAIRDAQRQYIDRLNTLYRQASGADRQVVEQVRRCVIGTQRAAEHALDASDEGSN